MRRSSFTVVAMSLRSGTFVSDDRGIREQRRREDRQRGVLGTRDLHLAVEASTADDHELVHGYTVAPAVIGARALHSSGVKVCSASAWISRPTREPSVA